MVCFKLILMKSNKFALGSMDLYLVLVDLIEDLLCGKFDWCLQ